MSLDNIEPTRPTTLHIPVTLSVCKVTVRSLTHTHRYIYVLLSKLAIPVPTGKVVSLEVIQTLVYGGIMKNPRGYQSAEDHNRLRNNAQELIKMGATPRTHGGVLSVDTLALLYQQASTPETAANAMKLLHELQTHQVELDLLHEQLKANEHEANEELAHYKSVYECAPVAYLIVANDGEIIEGNQAAGTLFNERPIALAGKPLLAFLTPGQKGVVNRLLKTPENEISASASIEKAFVDLPDCRRLMISARRAETEGSVLMILAETTAYPDES
ncbi:MAG TPA: hypothetical protein VL091_09595 [Marinobacter sp.]|nr:hypothetical protein [Marinobacter sp.]